MFLDLWPPDSFYLVYNIPWYQHTDRHTHTSSCSLYTSCLLAVLVLKLTSLLLGLDILVPCLAASLCPNPHSAVSVTFRCPFPAFHAVPAPPAVRFVPASGSSGHCLVYSFSFPLQCLDCWSLSNCSWLLTNLHIYLLHLYILITLFSSDYCKELAKYRKV